MELDVREFGPIHVLFTVTLLSTDGFNWISQVKVMLPPIVVT